MRSQLSDLVNNSRTRPEPYPQNPIRLESHKERSCNCVPPTTKRWFVVLRICHKTLTNKMLLLNFDFGLGLCLFLALTVCISICQGIPVATMRDESHFLKLASRHTSDSLLDDLRACTFCFPYNDRHRCSRMMRTAHQAKAGTKIDVGLISDEVLSLFDINSRHQEQINCLALRAENPSSTPRPPSSLQIDFEYSPLKNTRMLANDLKSEISGICRPDVGISVEFEIVDWNTTDHATSSRQRSSVAQTEMSQELHLLQPARHLHTKIFSDIKQGIVRTCSGATCAARVTVRSRKNVEITIVRKAVKKLQSNENFKNSQIFNPKKYTIRNHGKRTYFVQFPFTKEYWNNNGWSS